MKKFHVELESLILDFQCVLTLQEKEEIHGEEEKKKKKKKKA